MKVGDAMSLILLLPGESSPTAVDLALVRWGQDACFGVEFVSMGTVEQDRLRQFVVASSVGASTTQAWAMGGKGTWNTQRHCASPVGSPPSVAWSSSGRTTSTVRPKCWMCPQPAAWLDLSVRCRPGFA